MKKILGLILVMVMLLYGTAFAENYNTDTTYSGKWAEGIEKTAQEKGLYPDSLANIYDFTTPITREQFCDITYLLLNKTVNLELLEYKPSAGMSIDDTKSSTLYTLFNIGILNGKNRRTVKISSDAGSSVGVVPQIFSLAPNDALTREEAATILYRVAKYLKVGYFYENFLFSSYWYIDSNEFSDWATESISQLHTAGIMNGIGNDMFAPKDTYTIDQSIATILRIYHLFGNTKRLTLEKIKEISKKGSAISFEDFKEYWGQDIGSGLYIMKYPVDNTYDLMVGGGELAGDPIYAYLINKNTEEHIDIRTQSVEDFINGRYAPVSFEWKLNALMPKDKNYIFSPISIKMAIAMAANGASGETQKQILDTLDIERLDLFNKLSEGLINDYRNNKYVNLKIANSIWLNTDYYKNVDFNPDFAMIASKSYDATGGKVNNNSAIEEINKWVADNTNNKIEKIIDDSEFLAALVNAIYFKGDWKFQFNENATKKDTFVDRNGNEHIIDFMNMTAVLEYFEDDNMQIVKLPYKDNKTSMYIVIGESSGAENLLKNGGFVEHRVQISLPKFKMEYNENLNEMLQKLGITTTFNSVLADFKPMFTRTQDNIFIQDVLHKTFINVDEFGTEAAAVTAVIMAGGADQLTNAKIFKADRPFTYFIRDDANGEMLFMGEYAYAK